MYICVYIYIYIYICIAAEPGRGSQKGGTLLGRADIEGSKNVAMNAWLPHASYPCGNFSDTSS